MRAVFGVLSLLIVVAVIGLLAKRQLGAVSIVNATPETPAGVNQPAMTPQQRSQQLQSQVKKSVDDAMQQRRPEVDDK
jgi:Na+-transporting methylmalonyl-CoA/oxaloacetate decarboxylase gamma subunit